MANVGNDYSLGVELSTQLKVTKWWNLDVNGNIYYYKVMNNINSGGKRKRVPIMTLQSITFFGFIRIPVFSWTGISWVLRLLHKGGRILLVCQSGYSSAVVQSSSAIYPLLSGYIQFCPLQKWHWDSQFTIDHTDSTEIPCNYVDYQLYIQWLQAQFTEFTRQPRFIWRVKH